MPGFIFTGGGLFEPRSGQILQGHSVWVEDGLVKEVSDKPLRSAEAATVDLGGRTLMPGLIDNHVHMYYFLRSGGAFHMNTVSATYSGAMAAHTLRMMLLRGFTTVRDMGGGDHGMREAANHGFAETPRLFLAGRAISQTGGHGDFRSRVDDTDYADACCTASQLMCVVADGVPGVIRAVRNELRKGADQIKLMLSGGVASPYDPLDSIQYSTAEIAAAVDEAARWGVYVGGHAYSDEAISRAVSHGVRTIEHGNFLEARGAGLMKRHDAFLVPTLVTYAINKRLGPASGKSPEQLRKNEIVHAAGLQALDLCRSAGVPIGFGTDLMTYTQTYQTEGLAVQAQVQGNAEVLKSATIVNAAVLRQEGKLGELVPGAHADLLVVDGDPTRDLGLFQDGGPHLAAIMKAGRFIKNTL